MFVGVVVAIGRFDESEGMGTAISWVYVVDGATIEGSFGAIGTGGGGCMIWNVGCSDSSDNGGNGTLGGSDGSSGGGAGGSGCGTSGTTTGTGTVSTCILFEQFKYLKLKKNLSFDHLFKKLPFIYFSG